MHWFWQHYLNNSAEAESTYASPLRAFDLRSLPPALVVTAEFDPLRDQGEAYALRLQQAGVPVTCKRYDGMIHCFLSFAPRLQRAKDGLEEVTEVLRGANALV